MITIISFELWTLGFMICANSILLLPTTNFANYANPYYKRFRIIRLIRSRLLAVVESHVICSDKPHLISVIIIMNFELCIMNYSSNHNYEFWIMNSELLQRLHEQHAHLEDHSTNYPG